MATTIFERLEKKIDRVVEKSQKEAEKKVMRQRITEMVRGLNFFEKMELHIKIGL
jgi:hypothetical protein